MPIGGKSSSFWHTCRILPEFSVLHCWDTAVLHSRPTKIHSLKYSVPEVALLFWAYVIPLNHLELKIEAPIVVFRIVFQPKNSDRKLFVIRRSTRRVLSFSSLYQQRRESKSFRQDGTKFQFPFNGFNVTRGEFSARALFAITLHKGQGQTLWKGVVDLWSNPFLSR